MYIIQDNSKTEVEILAIEDSDSETQETVFEMIMKEDFGLVSEDESMDTIVATGDLDKCGESEVDSDFVERSSCPMPDFSADDELDESGDDFVVNEDSDIASGQQKSSYRRVV